MAGGCPHSWRAASAQSPACHPGLPQRPLPYPAVSLRATGPLPPSAVAQGPQLLIRSVDESINTTFICRATNALGTGEAEQTVLVRGEEAPGWGEQAPKEAPG